MLDTIFCSRYKILEILGQGGIGTTYKTEDLQTQATVALKVISLRQSADWKTLDLFEREVRVLQQLNHPAIPQYLDSFELDTPDDRLFCIVQALAPGKTLTQWIQDGWQPDEQMVQAIATRLLEILVYLQKLLPPILHRDIKPQNILRDRNGQIYLVDFGTVQDTYCQTITGGSTVVGTLGYMAPEQFRGKASLATDLYGLGTTLQFLLSGQDPNDLKQDRNLRLILPTQLKISRRFKQWLQCCMEPIEEDRLPSAADALLALQSQDPIAHLQNSIVQRPRDSKITMIKTDHALTIRFDSNALQKSKLKWVRPRMALYVAYTVLIGIFLMFTLSSNLVFPIPIIRLLLLVTLSGFVSLLLLVWELQRFRPSTLRMSHSFVKLEGNFEVFGDDKGKFFQYGRITLMPQEVEAVRLGLLGKRKTTCILKTVNQSEFTFGTYLSFIEQRWLVREIRSFIQQIQQNHESSSSAEQEIFETADLERLNSILQKGMAYYKNASYRHAEKCFKNILLTDDRFPEVHNNLGVVQYQRQQCSDAIASFQTALDLAPSYWAAQVHLAVTLQAQGRFEESILVHTRPCPTGHRSGKAHQTLILYNKIRVSLAEASDLYAVEDSAYSLANHAYLHYLQGDVTGAITLYRHALTRVTDKSLERPEWLAGLFTHLGLALIMTGAMTEACDQLAQADSFYRSFPKPHPNAWRAKALLEWCGRSQQTPNNSPIASQPPD
jgi:serine/threonine protein kinase